MHLSVSLYRPHLYNDYIPNHLLRATISKNDLHLKLPVSDINVDIIEFMHSVLMIINSIIKVMQEQTQGRVYTGTYFFIDQSIPHVIMDVIGRIVRIILLHLNFTHNCQVLGTLS